MPSDVHFVQSIEESCLYHQWVQDVQHGLQQPQLNFGIAMGHCSIKVNRQPA